MLNLARNGYTVQDVADALNAVHGARTLQFRYELLSSSNVHKKNLTTVLQGSISYDSTATLQRTAKFTIMDDPAILWPQDRIKPWIRVLMPDGGFAEFPAGIFLLSTPDQTVNATGGYVSRTVAGYDQLQVLTDWKTADRYAIAAGVAYTTAMTTLLTAAGFTGASLNITPSASTLPVVQEWSAGTSYLTMLNFLAGTIAYDPIWFNADGIAQLAPTILPTVQASLWSYSDGVNSTLIPGLTRNYDLFAVPNVFVLVVSDPARASALRSVYTNSNPSSPTSTVSRGRSITSYDDKQTAPNQTTLDTLAAQAAFKASQVYETLAFSTLIMPQHEYLDVITVAQGELGISALYQETGWSYTLAAGSTMTHKVKRIVPV